jgi:hypothetical protein
MRRVLGAVSSCIALLAACSADERVPFAPTGDAGVDATLAPSSSDAGCTGDACAKLKLAFTRIFVGDTDRGGNPLSYAWEYYGEDYDHLHSSYLLDGECLPADGAPPYAPLDGINGYDNVWGQRILPLLAPWDPTPSKANEDALKLPATRRPMILLGQLGGAVGGVTLHASITYFADGKTEPTLVTYDEATFENGTFDSGPAPALVPFDLLLGARSIRLPIRRLRVHFDLSDGGKAIGGQVSGAIAIADLEAAVADHVARTSPADCASGKIETLRKSIAAAADVLADGRQDSAAHCDAISFGIGFEAAPAEVTGAIAAAPAPAGPCL